jgi:hypothetical protein
MHLHGLQMHRIYAVHEWSMENGKCSQRLNQATHVSTVNALPQQLHPSVLKLFKE